MRRGKILMMVTAAERMREKRKRDAAGIDLLHNVPFKHHFGLIDFLIDQGRVNEENARYPRVIEIAVGRLLEGVKR